MRDHARGGRNCGILLTVYTQCIHTIFNILHIIVVIFGNQNGSHAVGIGELKFFHLNMHSRSVA